MSLSGKAKKTAKLAVLVLANLLLVALLGEAILRMSLTPIDHLEPDLVEHEILPVRISPNSNGHDRWGFRNLAVPETTEVVALGDSWTYGVGATASESWPSWLQRDTQQSIYNLGVFAYGPPDYLYLLETRGLLLKPKVVVVGLSYSTDFLDTYERLHNRDYWSRFRDEGGFELPPRASRHDGARAVSAWELVRGWLRRRSVLFQVTERGPIGRTFNEIARRTGITAPKSCLIGTEGRFHTLVSPDFAMAGVDMEKPQVRAGVEASKKILLEIATLSRTNGARLVVALFPTKERVHQGRLAYTEDRDCMATFERLTEWEAKLDSEMKLFLESHEIEFVDILPWLRSESKHGQIFFADDDVHPNGKGYRVIGRAIADHLSGDVRQSATNTSHVQNTR